MPRLLVFVAIASASGTLAAQKPPAPLASERVDLDGDGILDRARVTSGGEVEIALSGGATTRFELKAGSGARVATLATAGVKSEHRVLATLLGPDGVGEALFLSVARKRVSELWRGRIGIDDADTQTRLVAELIDGELVVYFDNPAVTRCDGVQSRLDARRLDKRGLVATSPPIGVAPSAQTLAANVAPPSAIARSASASFFDPGSASSAKGTPSPDLLVGNVVTLGDGDPRTEWVEGRPGSGRGEFVSFRAKKPEPVTMLRVIAGTARSAKEFAAHNRPQRIALVFDSGERYWVELGDEPMGTPQYILLPQPVRARCVTLVIDSVYPDASERRDRGATALSEVAVLTALDLSPGGIDGALIDLVLAGKAEGRSAAKKLARRGPQAVGAIEARLADSGLASAKALVLRRILAAIGASPAELAIGLGQRNAGERDREELGAALLGLGGRSIPALRALISNRKATVAGRQRGAAVLGDLRDPRATVALIELLQVLDGRDAERKTRAAVARALGKRPARALPQLLTAAKSARGNIAADMHRAVGLLARRADAAGLAEAAAVLVEAFAQERSYEQSYRLLAALSGLESQQALELVESHLQKSQQSRRATDVALRRVATRALGRNKSAAASSALIVATRDVDAGVREAAARALAARIELEASDAPLSALLASDAWPAVRRSAAGALAARCQRAAPREALRAAVATEKNTRVGQVVLTSVVNCGGAGTAELLIAVARSGKRPTGMRAHAITLLGQLGGADAARSLIELFERFVRDSFSQGKAIALASAAAGGLCRVKEPAAIKPLADAAENSAYPEIQAAAARALGCYCDPATAPVLRSLARHPKASVNIAAKRSLERCRRR